MRKFVLIALVALFAVAAAQEITDFKFKNLTHSNNKTFNKSIFANKIGGVGNNIVVKSKNFTNHVRSVANKTGSWVNKNKNFSKSITGKIPNLGRPILGRPDKKNTSVVGRPNRTFVLRPNHTIRPNRTFIRRPNKTNRTNKTGRIVGGLQSWFSGNGLEGEESSEATEDFSAVGPKNRTSRNRTFLKGRPDWSNKSNKSSKSNKTGKAAKASEGGFFEAIKSWFLAEDQQEDDVVEEEEDYTVKNKTVSPKNKSVGLWGKVSSWFGGKKNDTKKPQPQKKNTTNVTQVQKKNSSSSSNKTQPQKKNTTTTANVTQPQKKNISNKTQPQKKNTSNKTQPQKNNSQKNQTKKINQLELEDLAWNSDKKPTPGLLGSSLPPF